MSTAPGQVNKGEKSRDKFKTLNINSLYAGKSVETQKSTVIRQHGLQSLGKVGSTRRMPPPANLPSLRSENSGNDPNVSLVPTGGAGWGKDKPNEPGHGNQPSPSTPSSNSQHKTPLPSTCGAHVGGASQPARAHSAPHVAPPGDKPGNQTGSPGGGSATSGQAKSWSSVTTGDKKGNFLGQQSPYFHEEFPKLASAPDDKSTSANKPKTDDKDQGLSLRPQNVASWREGGGRSVPQPSDDEPGPAKPHNGLAPAGPAGHGGSPPPAMGGPRPGGPGGGPVPPLMAGMPPQFRGMLPPYMYRGPFPPPGGFPPGYIRPPFPFEPRYRGPMPPQRSVERGGGPDDRDEKDDNRAKNRPAIIQEKDLKSFDMRSDADSDWAGVQGEVDYNEKLVFSDEEEGGRARDHDRGRRGHKEDERKTPKDGKPRTRDYNYDKEEQAPVREAWPAGQPPMYGPAPMMDGQRGWAQRVPFDHRGPPPGAYPGYPPHMGHPHKGRPPQIISVREVSEDEESRRRRNQEDVLAAHEMAKHRREEEARRLTGGHRREEEAKCPTAGKDGNKEGDEKSPPPGHGPGQGQGQGQGQRSRNTSESSDGKSHRDAKYNQFAKNVPPRFQKLQQQQQQGEGGPARQPPSSPQSTSTAKRS